MIILLTLITISLGNIWILLGENWCWPLSGLKGLNGNESDVYIALIFWIWSVPVGYEELAAGLEPIRNGKISWMNNIHCYPCLKVQGAKKITFTACHLGKLKLTLILAQTSFQLVPKAFWRAELISQFFCYSNSSKKITCPLGKLKTEFTSPIAKSTSPGLLDITFFAR